MKEQRRRERIEAEHAAEQADRRSRRRRLVGGGMAVIATVVAAGAVALVTTREDDTEDPRDAFAAKPDGLNERVQSAGLTPGPDHFHPTVKVYAAGAEIPIPDELGNASDGGHVGVHRHPGDPKVHAEGIEEGTFTLGQLMAVWGVPLSKDRLGPYRAAGSRAVTVFVKDPGEKRFNESPKLEALQLRDGQEVYVAYGTPQQSPIAQ